jgi:hypothetical protein
MDTQDKQCSECKHFKPLLDIIRYSLETCACRNVSNKSKKRSLQDVGSPVSTLSLAKRLQGMASTSSTQDKQCSNCKHLKPIGDFYKKQPPDLTKGPLKTCAGCRHRDQFNKSKKRSFQDVDSPVSTLPPAKRLQRIAPASSTQDKQCPRCKRFKPMGDFYKKQPPDFAKNSLKTKTCAECRYRDKSNKAKAKQLRVIAPASPNFRQVGDRSPGTITPDDREASPDQQLVLYSKPSDQQLVLYQPPDQSPDDGSSSPENYPIFRAKERIEEDSHSLAWMALLHAAALATDEETRSEN